MSADLAGFHIRGTSVMRMRIADRSRGLRDRTILERVGGWIMSGWYRGVIQAKAKQQGEGGHA